jgi:hypothetical protein
MKTILHLCALTALLSVAACAQPQPRYSATTGDVSLTAAGTTLTLQQTATPTKQFQLETATVYCSVACIVTQSQNGTAATTTAGTLVPIAPTYKATGVTAFTASNVGAGTAVGGSLHLAAGQTVVLDLSQIVIGSSPNANYSVSVSTITGTANITVIETERI